MKKTALNHWRGIAMLAGMVLLSLGACKKDSSGATANTQTTPNLSVDFKPKTLALTGYKSSSVINYNGQNSVTISGLSIQGGSSPCINLTNCTNIHITQCAFSNSTVAAIQMYNCSNITIDYCYFANNA